LLGFSLGELAELRGNGLAANYRHRILGDGQSIPIGSASVIAHSAARPASKLHAIMWVA
jgi:hypothetical protein